jgi:sulfite oxidase
LLIADNYVTPNELWYCRHHHPVPHIDPETFRLGLLRETSRPTKGKDGEPAESTDATYVAHRSGGGLSLSELKRDYPKHTITATMQCGGNRRAALNAHGKTQGLAWDVGAISTATWGGARLRDVLADQYGIRTLEDAARMGVKHVHFLPFDPPYDASIPIEKALDARMDVILAYEMNGVDIPAEHGYPVRVVVPGGIGARNVKWCQTIRVASEESDSVWQRNVQYKGFSPNVKKFDASVDVKGALSVQEMPVQSAVTSCAAEVEPDDDEMEVQGYAWSGGGRNIVRVDVTSDGEFLHSVMPSVL